MVMNSHFKSFLIRGILLTSKMEIMVGTIPKPVNMSKVVFLSSWQAT